MSLLKIPPFDSELPETRVAIEAATKAGKEVMKIYHHDFTTTFKNDNEPLTQADLESNFIINQLILPFGYPILSEEDKDDKKRLKHNKIWIIDPLDGTTDFVNKTGEFTIMIALVENHKPILGIIYWPTQDQLYLAQKGFGAYQFVDKIGKEFR